MVTNSICLAEGGSTVIQTDNITSVIFDSDHHNSIVGLVGTTDQQTLTVFLGDIEEDSNQAEPQERGPGLFKYAIECGKLFSTADVAHT